MKPKNLSFPADYTIVDIETTGLNAGTDTIIEIGAIKVRNHQIIAEFSELIHPNVMISPFITKLTGITNQMVKNCESIEVILVRFLDFAQEDIIIGHNVSFDLGFLIKKCQALGIQELLNSKLDTLSISRKKLPSLPHHRLGDLVEYFNIPAPNAHRALADCQSTKAVYDCLRNMDIFQSQLTQHPFTNKKIMISGHLTWRDKNEVLLRLNELQASVDKTLTTKTDILVLANLKDIHFIEPLALGKHPFIIISEKEFCLTLFKDN